MVPTQGETGVVQNLHQPSQIMDPPSSQLTSQPYTDRHAPHSIYAKLSSAQQKVDRKLTGYGSLKKLEPNDCGSLEQCDTRTDTPAVLQQDEDVACSVPQPNPKLQQLQTIACRFYAIAAGILMFTFVFIKDSPAFPPPTPKAPQVALIETLPPLTQLLSIVPATPRPPLTALPPPLSPPHPSSPRPPRPPPSPPALPYPNSPWIVPKYKTLGNSPFCTDHGCGESCCSGCGKGCTSRHILYLHVPKTGGSSIECAA